jgi:hypothetical protein
MLDVEIPISVAYDWMVFRSLNSNVPVLINKGKDTFVLCKPSKKPNTELRVITSSSQSKPVKQAEKKIAHPESPLIRQPVTEPNFFIASIFKFYKLLIYSS